MATDYGYGTTPSLYANKGGLPKSKAGPAPGPTPEEMNDAAYERMFRLYQEQAARNAAMYGAMLRQAGRRVPMPTPPLAREQYAEQLRMMADVPRGQRNVATFLYGY